MDFSTSVGFLSLILAIPLAIVANLLTPRAAAWWATTNENRRQKRIAKLGKELARLKSIGPRPDPRPLKGPKVPVLVRGDISRVGMGNPQTRQMGFQAPEGLAFFVLNAEQRFPTNAHNLRAELTLRYIDGKKVHIENAPWFKNTSSARPGAFYFQTVTVGMLETAAVVYAIQREQAFYQALYDDAEKCREGQKLQFGEWMMDLKIEGDNCEASFQGKLQFLPNGSSGFTPLDSSTAAAV